MNQLKERNFENEFGELIRKRRLSKGYSLDALAEMTNIEKSYISRLERGERKNPGFTTVIALSKALELKTEEVMKAFGYNWKKDKHTRLMKEHTLSERQKEKLQQISTMIFNMATSKEYQEGHLSNIMKQIEEFRKNVQQKEI